MTGTWDPIDLADTIGLAYEAALDSVLWRPALEATARLLQADVASLFLADETIGASGFAGMFGRDQSLLAPYAAHYGAIDERPRLMLGKLAGEVYADEVTAPLSVVAKGIVHNEYYRAIVGIDYVLGTFLFREPGRTSTLALERERQRGAFTAEHVALAERLLVPHFQRALRLQRQLAVTSRQMDVGTAAIEAVQAALFVVDRQAKVLAANQAAENLLAGDAPVAVRGGVLIGRNARETTALHAAIAKSLLPVTLQAPPEPPVLRLGPCKTPLLIAPAVPPASLNLPLARAALVFVEAQDGRKRPPVDLLRRAYALTPAEARTAAALATGASLNDIADENAASIHTVRTLIKRAMAKTDTNTQAQLVRMVLSGLGGLPAGVTKGAVASPKLPRR